MEPAIQPGRYDARTAWSWNRNYSLKKSFQQYRFPAIKLIYQSSKNIHMLADIQVTGNKDTRSGFGDGILEAACSMARIVALTLRSCQVH